MRKHALPLSLFARFVGLLVLVAAAAGSAPGQTTASLGKLVFSQGAQSNELWVTDVDGSNARKLATVSSYIGSPRWSPDGQRIAFATPTAPGYPAWIINADGTGLYQVPGVQTTDSGLTWNATGTGLVYATFCPCCEHLRAVDVDGGNNRLFFRPPEGVTMLPDIRPNDPSPAKMVAYHKGLCWDVPFLGVELARDGGADFGSIPGSPGVKYQYLPRWSSDGQKLLTVVEYPATQESALEILDPLNPSAARTRFLQAATYFRAVDFSCTTDTVLFVRLTDNFRNIWQATIDGTNTQVTNFTSGWINGIDFFCGQSVNPNRPPIADAGPDQTVEATSPTSTPVTLSGSASDPDGDPLTFTWTGPFGTLTGQTVNTTLPMGRHTITLTVSDGKGGTPTDTLTVTVQDTTPPVIQPTVTPAPNAAGWNNSNVTVNWSVSDPGSGIASSSGCGTTTYSDETAGLGITCLAINSAGLTQSASVIIKIDKTAPIAAAGVLPLPSAAGWNNTNVTVTFTGADNLSGIESCSLPVTLANEGAQQAASGTCTDQAGNVAKLTAGPINIDLTPPRVTFLSATPPANNAGWNNTDVTLPYATSDNLSGVASASPASPLVFRTEGTAVGGTVTVTDKAGNSAAYDSARFKIDKTPPAIFATSPISGSVYLRTQAVPSNYSCADALSGPATCVGPVLSGANFDTATLGPKNFGVTTTDVAGNGNVAAASYRVNPSATISVLAALHTVGQETKPRSTKAPLVLEELRVFDKAKVASLEPKDFEAIWTSGRHLVFPNVSVSGPTEVSVGGGMANRYLVLLPAADPANTSIASGSYLVIGRAVIGGLPVFVGNPTGPLASDSVTQAYLQVIQNANGKAVPAKTTAVTGSLLLIIEAEYLEFTSDRELLPVIYESVDGYWSATVQADPPEGFVSTPGAVQLEVNTSGTDVAQFTIRDVGSSWTSTRVTHHLKHNGNTKTVVTEHRMINKRK